jgi:predicted AAA+ superfamily ATPase
MPHSRARHCQANFDRKLAHFPVITIQGPRQCGKSFFVREIVAKTEPSLRYLTFDHSATRSLATTNPDTFLEQNLDIQRLAIDEAQKVPPIFDAIKFQVDQVKRPGRYILLGSTEFSREFLIRESMTGRISRTRMFTFNLAEAHQISPNPSQDLVGINRTSRISRKLYLRHLVHGGFPGIFAVREESERNALFDEWISTTVYRDLNQFPKIKVNSDLSLSILKLIATIDEPEVGRMASVLRLAPRSVDKHVKLLEQLFVIQKLSPIAFSTGKDRYYLCDVGLASRLGATLERQIETLTLMERISQNYYEHGSPPEIYYYRSQKGALTHFVEVTSNHVAAVMIQSQDALDLQKLKRLEAFKSKAEEYYQEIKQKKTVHLYVLAAVDRVLDIEGVTVFPWEAIC